MPITTNQKLSAELLNKALEFGADLAGFVDSKSLKHCPSHRIYSRLPKYSISECPSIDTAPEETQPARGGIFCPQGTQSILIIAIRHPENRPALDHWKTPFFGGTEGNLQLIRTNNKVIKWLKETKNIKGEQFPYSIEQGGIFLKDAAVLAGLGVIGQNNMLVTPRFGPRVRLRALALPVKLPSAGPISFDPCASCEMFCRKACPQNAFDQQVFSSRADGQAELPAREGVYARAACKREGDKNRNEAEIVLIEGKAEPMRVVDYCRACEFACPVGQ